MTAIEIRPNFRTTGGELSDIMVNGAFAGIMTLIYREGDRLAGSIQLDEESIDPGHMDEIRTMLHAHIQSLVYAVDAEACDVIMTFGPYEEVLAADPDVESEAAEGIGYEPGEAVSLFDDEDDDEMEDDDRWASLDYELVVVEENRSKVLYHLYDEDGSWLAEAELRTDRADISGEIRWIVQPDEAEIEFVTELLVSDFDEDEVDTFLLNHLLEGELIEAIDLTHEELLENDQSADPIIYPSALSTGDYSILLARDDGDILTYEIYNPAQGSLPIGTATVDIQERRLTGFIDFRTRSDIDDAPEISAMLMRELDKEKDYDGINLSFMYRNRLVDEIVIENEAVH